MDIADLWVYSGKLSLEDIFERPSQWPVQAVYAGYTFCMPTFNLLTTKAGNLTQSMVKLVAHHLHVVHIIALSIFFGPIIALLPFLLIHELVISLLFNLSFLMHGLVPGINFLLFCRQLSYTCFALGTADTHYSYLRKTLLSTKESVFASVDSAGSIYNKWTIDFAPLAVLRITALGLGCYALYEIWGIE